MGDSVKLPLHIPNIRDHTSPLRRKQKYFRPNEGHVLRFDKNGRNPAIYAAGLRNPYGIDFNADGEAFTFDADAEFDMGSPWYRPTQIKHITSGADFGWRAVTGSWPPYYLTIRQIHQPASISARPRLRVFSPAIKVASLSNTAMPSLR